MISCRAASVCRRGDGVRQPADGLRSSEGRRPGSRDPLEETHRRAAEAPRPQAARQVPGSDPLLYVTLIRFKATKDGQIALGVSGKHLQALTKLWKTSVCFHSSNNTLRCILMGFASEKHFLVYTWKNKYKQSRNNFKYRLFNSFLT